MIEDNPDQAGIYDYIYKPDYTPRELARKIREII